jgi:hypothetical protein
MIGVALLLALAGAAAWAPWISDSGAKARTVAAFDAAQSQIMDGCGFNCKGCGAVSTRKVAFGRRVRIEYACGLLPADLPQYHRQREVFVSAIGTVHGLP